MSRCFVALAQDTRLLSAGLLTADVLQQSAAMGVKRRPQFLAGRRLLATLMREHFGCQTLPEIRYAPGGKPVFCDPALPHFSLSHSGHQALVAVCQTEEIGADVETLRPRASMLNLAEQLFSPPETQWLLEQGEYQSAAFWQLWTLREALLKQQGRGVWHMASISIDPISQRFTGAVAPSRLANIVDADCAVALALPLSVAHIEAFRCDSRGALSPWSAPWRFFLEKE